MSLIVRYPDFYVVYSYEREVLTMKCGKKAIKTDVTDDDFGKFQKLHRRFLGIEGKKLGEAFDIFESLIMESIMYDAKKGKKSRRKLDGCTVSGWRKVNVTLVDNRVVQVRALLESGLKYLDDPLVTVMKVIIGSK